MRVEFFVNPSEGLSGVLMPINFHDCPTVYEGYIQFGGSATLAMDGDRRFLRLRGDSYTHANAEVFNNLVREASSRGIECNPRTERQLFLMDVPIKNLRSRWTESRLLCYAEVGEDIARRSSMEIPGVTTVLVVCRRLGFFQNYFRDRNPDRVSSHAVEFGQTRYVHVRDHNWQGLRPDETRWTTLGPTPIDGIRTLSELEVIAARYEHVSLKEDPRPAPAEEQMTATGWLMRRARSQYEVGRVSPEDLQDMLTAGRESPPPIRPTMSPEPNSFIAGWLRGQRDGLQLTGIGDLSCVNNARDRHLRCAVNPMGPCEGCEHFEKRDD